MTDDTVIDVSARVRRNAARSMPQRKYRRDVSRRAVTDPLTFLARTSGKRLDWITPYSRVRDVSFDEKDLHIRWYLDGALNASFNCLDRHLKHRADQIAIIWEGDDPKQSKHVTYRELYEMTCRLANALKTLGVKKGDRVCIYLPMIIEAAAAMLACARIGAVHSVIFGGFAPHSVADRINDCGAKHGDHQADEGPCAAGKENPAQGECRCGAGQLSA